MAKRISKSANFMHGVRMGKTVQHFAIQLASLLDRSGLTAKEAAHKAGMEEIRFVKLLCADYYTFITLKLDDLTRLAQTFDVAIEVKMQGKEPLKIPIVVVKTFDEESSGQ